MSNTIFNPGAGRAADFYTVAGVGSTGVEVTGIKIRGGAAMNIKNTSLLDGVALGRALGNPVSAGTTVVRGLGNGVGAAMLGTVINAKVHSASGSYVAISGIAGADNTAIQALATGSWVYVTSSGQSVAPGSSLNLLFSTQKISTVTTGNVAYSGTISTTLPYNVVYSGQSVTLYPVSTTYDFNKFVAGRYIGQKITTMIAGVANTSLKYGSNAGMLTRSIHKVEAVRTTRVTSALRAGYYNKFTGKWSTVPVKSDDSALTNSTITSDNAAAPTRGIPGELTYKGGAINPISTDYKAKTD